jgi:thiamine-phosphate pyrophosphorylase
MTAFDPHRLGLLVLTSAAGPGHRAVAHGAIEGGATSIQLRAPELGDDELLPLAVDLRARCRAAGVGFFLNDRPDLAVAVDADGVHVGQRDDPLTARRRLGGGRWLGVSVDTVAQAVDAASEGADYVAVTVWGTDTKPEAVPRGLEAVARIAREGIPVVGIGGIDAGNAGRVLDAGAAGVAVISAVAGAKDPVAATRELRAVLDAHRRIGTSA